MLGTRHYGTLGLAEQAQLSTGYDAVADHMWMEPRFYRSIAQKVRQAGVPPAARVIDVGCGTGPMLGALRDAGFAHLSGVDFSARCVQKTHSAVPTADVWQHDIMAGPLPAHDVVLMTEVIEHVRDPLVALDHVRRSLAERGVLFLSFPNRWAYWPGYVLNPLRGLLPWARARSAFDFLTLPYEMRSTQPIDHAYSVPEVRTFLDAAGFDVVREDGLVLWPMLRVAHWPWTYTVFDALEDSIGRLWPRQACYRYLFTCVPRRQ